MIDREIYQLCRVHFVDVGSNLIGDVVIELIDDQFDCDECVELLAKEAKPIKSLINLKPIR